MKTNLNMTNSKTNYWPMLAQIGLRYGKQITLANGMLRLEGCPREFATAKEIYTYCAERQPVKY